MSGIRAFIGIPIPDDIVAALVSACQEVKNADPAWRDEKWVPAQNMHVTLKFLGDFAPSDLEALGDAIGRTAALHEPMDLTTLGLRAVPSIRRARMLWATFADADRRCAELAGALDRACLEFGVPADERAFKPHATLVRARRERALAEAALEAARASLADAPDSMSVRSVRLYSSRLTAGAPVYEALQEHRLGAA